MQDNKWFNGCGLTDDSRSCNRFKLRDTR